jgi:hypothetical protein
LLIPQFKNHVVLLAWLANVLMLHPEKCHCTELRGTGIEPQLLGAETSFAVVEAGEHPVGNAGSHIRYMVAVKERCISP